MVSGPGDTLPLRPAIASIMQVGSKLIELNFGCKEKSGKSVLGKTLGKISLSSVPMDEKYSVKTSALSRSETQ